ncbi:protein nessun dorma [Diabrotica virgifera virgifera]|uniref:Protein nessun dorma n=2 Tax=Diabrotica virgifera virgifera TaxID=50390 RepID=A0ABM5JY88_DIAVI|nr:protein nessun dorma [Diabrotica virgifera virgifera]
MDKIITFDKSFQQRYTEFNEVLSNYTLLPSLHLKKQWGFFIELTVDKIGWQAVWKIPRLKCEALGIPFPSVVLVIVLTINTKELKALVRILAVQDDIYIPEKHWVPLIQLWPTEEQDKSIALGLMQTANSLDMLRFFYLYVYMPWDRDEDVNIDWKETHLESRLRFYYDLKNGTIPRAVAEHIHCLLTEARRMQNKREFIENQLTQQEESEEFNKDTSAEKRTRALMEIHVHLLEIRTEIEIAENPLLREIIIERYSQLDQISKNTDPQIWLIFDQGTADEHIDFLTEVKSLYPKDNLKFCTNLASKLESANTKDTYLINESSHNIFTTGALEKGGVLRGIGSSNKVIITSDIEDVMLDFKSELVVLENLTIDAKSAQCAILVRQGNCILKNCKITGKGNSSIHQGIIVLKGAHLELENCELSGFSTAITGNSDCKVVLKDCDIYDADVGIKIFDGCSMKLEKVNIRECMEFGFILETDEKTATIGNFENLSLIPEIEHVEVEGSNNTRGDVAILQRPKLKPVKDLFANPDNDPTIIESDTEETLMC